MRATTLSETWRCANYLRRRISWLRRVAWTVRLNWRNCWPGPRIDLLPGMCMRCRWMHAIGICPRPARARGCAWTKCRRRYSTLSGARAPMPRRSAWTAVPSVMSTPSAPAHSRLCWLMAPPERQAARANLNGIPFHQAIASDAHPVNEGTGGRAVIFDLITIIGEPADRRVQTADGQVLQKDIAFAAAPDRGFGLIEFIAADGAAHACKIQLSDRAGIWIGLLEAFALLSTRGRELERACAFVRIEGQACVAEAEHIAILQEVGSHRLIVDEAIAASVIVAQQIALARTQNARLLTMDGQIFQEDIALAAAPDRGHTFPEFHALTHLSALFHYQIGGG